MAKKASSMEGLEFPVEFPLEIKASRKEFEQAISGVFAKLDSVDAELPLSDEHYNLLSDYEKGLFDSYMFTHFKKESVFIEFVKKVHEQALVNNEKLTVHETIKRADGLFNRKYSLSKPNGYSMLTSKLPNSHKVLGLDVLERGVVDGQLNFMELVVAKNIGKKHEEAFVVVGLNYDGVELNYKTRLTAYDKAVYNAVSSLWLSGNSQMTPRDIYNAMNGYSGIQAKDRQIERIDNSMRKYMGTIITIDMRNEIEKTSLKIRDKRVKDGVVESRLVHADRVMLTPDNGCSMHGYLIYAEPILLSYAKAKKQILTVDAKLLDTSDSVSNTEDVVVLREYLLQQIENMKNDKGFRDSRKITYDDIYEKTGLEQSDNREVQRKFRECVKSILESWKNKGYILDYNDVKGLKMGTPIIGVEIVIGEQPKRKQAARTNNKK